MRFRNVTVLLLRWLTICWQLMIIVLVDFMEIGADEDDCSVTEVDATRVQGCSSGDAAGGESLIVGRRWRIDVHRWFLHFHNHFHERVALCLS